ncbi:MAG: prohibitin family protein [Rhodothermales bacterium]
MANEYPNVTRAITRAGILGAVVLLIILMAAGCMTTSIGSGEAGVRYSIFGGTNLDQTYGEGLNVHPPWVDVITYDVRVQEVEEVMNVLSSNGLEIGVEVSIRWRPISPELPDLHVTYGPAYYQRLVQPELRSVMREVVGQYAPEELYSTKRAELQEQVFTNVQERIAGNHVELDAILIREVSLPDQIRTAIETKLKREQESLEYEFRLQIATQEAERLKIEAQGQAEYQQIITQSLSPQFLRFKGIEATQQLATSPNSKTVIVGSGDDGLPLILGGN